MNFNVSSSSHEPIETDLQDYCEDFFEHNHCGFLIINNNGEILRANSCIADWMGCQVTDITGKSFTNLLSPASKLYYEIQVLPLMRIQGYFEQAALQLSAHHPTQILVSGFERRNQNGLPLFVRLTISKATDRTLYEQTLQNEKASAENSLVDEKAVSALREQFIAVLGHDLRNPLAAIMTGSSVLLLANHNEGEQAIITTMQNSARRMTEMIENIMDFARGRLGGGMIIDKQPVAIANILGQVIDELRSAFPQRIIQTDFDITALIDCDAPRISQLFSNLLANALTHGSAHTPVIVGAYNKDNMFELSVSNSGEPIPATGLKKLFSPFTREAVRSSQNGLGLGLYIAAEISRAHQGELTVISDEKETRFTFRMKVAS